MKQRRGPVDGRSSGHMYKVLLDRFKLALFGSVCHLPAAALEDKVSQANVGMRSNKRDEAKKPWSSCLHVNSKAPV